MRIKHLVNGLALAAMASVVAVAQQPHAVRSGLIEANAPIERALGSPLTLLGQKLFYDRGLSRTGMTACATCHDPNYAFAQPTQVSQSDGGQLGLRNAPSLINAGVLPVLMWDGRFRTLEQQATSPFLRGEMGIDIREAERRLTLTQNISAYLKLH